MELFDERIIFSWAKIPYIFFLNEWYMGLNLISVVLWLET